MKEREWADQAACKGKPVEWWFAPDGHNKQEWEKNTRPKGRVICARCPVQAVCLDENIDEPFGVWGGFDVTERKEIRIGRKDRKELRLLICPRADCARSFATVNNSQMYCSSACTDAEKRRRDREKAEYDRQWRARRRAEERGELFDASTLKPHTYLVGRVERARERKQGEAS